MKRAFAIVGVCLLASIVIVSMGTTKQELTLLAIPKPGSGTAVKFNLPKASEVNLEIYDVTGRRVTNLLENQYLQAGKHTYLWDTRDAQGRQVSNGIYFVSLRADSEHRCIKLAYFAGGVIVGSPRDIEPEDAIDITEEDITKAERVKYEQDARKLAKAIAMALPDIQPALFDSIALAGDKMRHKVKLVSFTDPAISATLCNTGAIDELELDRIMMSYPDLLWIHVPVLVGGWTVAANPIDVVVVYPPYDEKEVKVVYGYNRNGQELTFDPWIPPDYPVFAITHESPAPSVEEAIPIEQEPKETRKSMQPNTSCCIRIWRYWKWKWDPWPDEEPEFYVHLWLKNPSTGDTTKCARANFYEVRKKCDNDKCENCDCYNVPEDGDNGYVFGVPRDVIPGDVVGTTQPDYPVFHYLRVYDDDTWGDDKAEAFNLRDMAVPPSAWYPGELKRADCPGKDPYECWGVDLYLNFVIPSRLFSFVVIADPHVEGEGSANALRLNHVVNKINAIRSTYNIKFVFVVGDIANYNNSDYPGAPEHPEYFNVAINELDQLHSSIEWLPLIGNHDIYYRDVLCDEGDDSVFNDKFASQYNHLASSLLNWSKQSNRANFSFDYYTAGRYLHFICLDWVCRGACGDCACKHSFTYDFYKNDLTNCNKSSHGIFPFAHHGCKASCGGCTDPRNCNYGFYNPDHYNDVTHWLHNNRRYIGKWFNGHEHRNHSYWIEGTCEVVTTEACADWKPGNALGKARLVEVYSDNHVEMSLIEGLWPSLASKSASANTTVYRNRTKSGSMQSVGTKE